MHHVQCFIAFFLANDLADQLKAFQAKFDKHKIKLLLLKALICLFVCREFALKKNLRPSFKIQKCFYLIYLFYLRNYK